jgi:hypothetical protein
MVRMYLLTLRRANTAIGKVHNLTAYLGSICDYSSAIIIYSDECRIGSRPSPSELLFWEGAGERCSDHVP